MNALIPTPPRSRDFVPGDQASLAAVTPADEPALSLRRTGDCYIPRLLSNWMMATSSLGLRHVAHVATMDD